MSSRIWTRETVIAAIRLEAQAGQNLSYSRVKERVPALLRAAERAFGKWSDAVKAAGIDYDSVRLYRKWTREMVIQRIQEWHAKGADLSWRNVSLKLDPALAAAALHAKRFSSWNEALRAAGLEPGEIMRYRRWTMSKMRRELEELSKKGVSLDQQSLQIIAPALLAAIYRVGSGLAAERKKTKPLNVFVDYGKTIPRPGQTVQ